MENNKNILIGAVILVLVLVGLVWFMWNRGGESDDPARYEISGEPQEVTNIPQRIEFTYYGGPEGYTLLESQEDTNLGDPLLSKAYTLVSTERYMETESTAGIGDQIPAITILVFDKATSTGATGTTPSAPSTATGTAAITEAEEPETSLREWAETYSGFTAYGLRTGDAEDAAIDNLSAIRFTSDGPFRSETYITEYRNKYYVIIGQYESEDSEIRRAFEKLLTQLYFL